VHEGENPQEHIAPAFGLPSVRAWEVTITTRLYLSTYLLQAADNFQKQSDKAEEPFRGDPPPIRAKPSEEISKALFEHSSYVLGAVFSAVAFLEAVVNELFIDAVEEYAVGPASQLSTDARQQLAAGWTHAVESMPILTKFQAALILAGKDSFDPGTQPYQSVYVLIQLRNKLTHFKPKSKSGASQDKWQRNLLRLGYEPSPGSLTGVLQFFEALQLGYMHLPQL
jgi:hypothetical protein